MSARPGVAALRCRLERLPPERVLEFVLFGFPHGSPFDAGSPAAPGGVRHDAAGRAALLHFAPGRWLVPAPSAGTLALLEAEEAAGAGASFDVTGKWQALRLTGTDAARLLSSSVDVAALLEDRECAALTLFDCPALVVRVADGCVLWVRASYAADLVTAIERLLAPG